MKVVMILALLLPAGVFAASPFDGTWKTRLDSVQVTGKPDKFSIANGMYTCDSCVPSYDIKADGTDQPISGHAYSDHEAVKIISPSTIETIDKKGGTLVFTQTLSVSADGAMLSGKFTSYTGKKPVNGTFTEKRTAAGPDGAHAISGSWMQTSLSDVADDGLTVKMMATPNGMKTRSNGQVSNAKFDGKEYPMKGDPGKTMVSLKKLDDRTIEETDRRLGKVTDVIVWTVSADGRTLNMVDTDPLHDTKTSMVMDKH